MSRFVLTAQLQLQAPNNVAQVVRQIQSQLSGVSVNIQVQGAPQAQRQIQQVTQNVQRATSAAERMGRAFAVSVRRFAAFSIATRAVGLFTSTLSDAVQTAIAFERQLVKVSQVTGKSVSELRGLTNEITSLSTGLGVASADLLDVSTVLAQAGLNAQDTAIALRTLAKAALAPNFDSISETAEGAIAILAQFQEGVGALESQLGSINAVAGAFAVEAGDLIDVIRRTGGIFKASGGSLNELLALFTSVRATTRESAESIGTGLRTIFTRIQRPKTIEFLKQFGVELVDLEGKFVGPFEAVRRLSEGLAGLGERDITFIKIAEELGGFRQIGKVLPLLQQFATAQSALNVATKANNSLSQDAASAQAALAIRITKVKEEFLALVRGLTETSTFQVFANTALSLASALIKLADSIKPLLPLLGAMAAIRLTRGIGGFLGGVGGGLASARTFSQGGKVHKFARGGVVPGVGNRDTVPAMLTPGEFVIRKSSVNKLGASNLAAMNENKYATGGKIAINPGAIGGFFLRPEKGQDRPVPLNFIGSISNPKVLNRLALTDGKKLKDLRPDAFYNATKEQQAQILGLPVNSRTKKITANSGLFDKQGKFIKRLRGKLIDYGYSPDVNYDGRSAFNNLSKKTKSGKLQLSEKKPVNITGSLSSYFPGMDDLVTSSVSQIVADNTRKSLKLAVSKSIEPVIQALKNPSIILNKQSASRGANRIANDPNAQATTQGFVFEGLIQAITGAKLAGSQSNFDFPASSISSSRYALRGMFANASGEGIDSLIKADAKRSNSKDAIESIKNKIVNDINKGKLEGLSVQKFASGGSVGTDTVPALLTPGEFVVNRSSAQRIGYGNLNRMNKVGKYAKGGIVQKFAAGTGTRGVTPSPVSGSGAGGNFIPLDALAKQAEDLASAQNQQKRSIMDTVSANKMFAASMMVGLMQGMLPALDENSSSLVKASHGLLSLVSTVTTVGFALEAFGVALNAQAIMQFVSGTSSLTQTIGNITGQFSGFGKMLGGLNGRLGGLGGKISGSVAKNLPTFSGAGTIASSAFKGGMKNLSPLTSVVNPYTGKASSSGMAGASGFQKFIANTSTRAGNFVGGIRSGLSGGKGVGGYAAKAAGPLTNTQMMTTTPAQRLAAAKANLGAGGSTTVKAGSAIGNKVGSAIGNVAGTLTKSVGTIVKSLNAAAGPLLAVQLGFSALSTVANSYFDYQNQANKAIQEGNTEKASENAVNAAAQESIDSFGSSAILAGAAIGSLVPGLGTVTGAVIGAGVALTTKFLPSIEKAIFGTDYVNRAFIWLGQAFGGNTYDSIKDLASAQAQAVKTQKAFEQGQKDASSALEDLQNGTISAGEALSKIANVEASRQALQNANEKAVKSNNENRSTGLLSYGREAMAYATFGYVDSVDQRNQRIDKENAGLLKQNAEAERKAFDISRPVVNEAIKRGISQGMTREQIDAQLGANSSDSMRDRMNKLRVKATEADIAGNTEEANAFREQALVLEEQAKELDKSFENLQKEAERTRKAFEAMNLGMQNVQGAAAAAALGVLNFVDSQQAGNIGLQQSLAVLEASVTSAAQGISDADFDAALGDAEKTLRNFGANDKQINQFKGNLKAVNEVQKNSATIFDQTKNELRGRLSAGGAEDRKKAFGEILGQNLASQTDAAGNRIYDDATIKRLQDQIATLDPDQLNELGQGNFAVFEEVLGDLGKKVLEQVNGPLNDAIKIQEQLNKITQSRIEAERNLMAAQQESLNIQMEAREIIAQYGGNPVTPADRRANIVAQANVEATGITGVGPLRDGSASEITARTQQISARQQEIANIRAAAAGGDADAQAQLRNEGGLRLEEEERKLQEASKNQIQITRDLIKAKEEELKTIREKNKLEKDSLESLISGDIEKFFDQQAAVGATAAISTGNSQLINAFGADALALAFSDIQRQQEAGVQQIFGRRIGGPGGLGEQAANAALGARGIQDPSIAARLAGTSPEEEAVKSEIRALAETMGPTSELQIEAARQQLNAAEIQYQTAQEIARRAVDNTADRAVGMYRGGVVYANRGIFVPRGTDTVPAMLTPGEFVVRREAVSRGNNLQLLQAMNNGLSNTANASGGVQSFARGGKVKYMANGGFLNSLVNNVVGTDVIGSLTKALTNFTSQMAQNIKALQDTKFKVTIDSANVNVNISGNSAVLAALTQEAKDEIARQVSREISNYKVGPGGKLVGNSSTMPVVGG